MNSEHSQSRARRLGQLVFSAMVATQFSGCGNDAGGSREQTWDDVGHHFLDAHLKELIDKQDLGCEQGACSESLVKVLLVNRGAAKFCTGFLVEENIVATSSQCLDDSLRVGGANCMNRVFFYFSPSKKENLTRANCLQVNSATSSPETNLLMRGGDIAFLQMDQRSRRETLRLSSDGIGDREPLTLWKTSPGASGFSQIEKQRCFASLNSLANPFAVSRFSPVIPVMGCQYEPGNEGSPLVNRKGDVVGVFNTPLEQTIADYLKNNDFQEDDASSPTVFISNIACAPKIGAMSGQCDKKPTQTQLSHARDRMINDPKVHRNSFLEVDNFLRSEAQDFKKRFLDWGSELLKVSPGVSQVIATPECFHRVGDWIDTMKAPVIFWQYKKEHEYDQAFSDLYIETKFDKFLKPFSKVVNKGMKNYSIKFSPRSLVRSSRSDVETITKGVKRIYHNILKRCP